MGAVPHGCTPSHVAVRHVVLTRRRVLHVDVVLLDASSTSPSTRRHSSPSARLHRNVIFELVPHLALRVDLLLHYIPSGRRSDPPSSRSRLLLLVVHLLALRRRVFFPPYSKR
eukprot:10969005-Heterocapsa_arctica.AAC.1